MQRDRSRRPEFHLGILTVVYIVVTGLGGWGGGGWGDGAGEVTCTKNHTLPKKVSGMSLTNLSLAGKNLIIPRQEELGAGNSLTFFHSVRITDSILESG